MASPAEKSLSRKAALLIAAVCAAIVTFEVWREWTAHDEALLTAQSETRMLARLLRQHAEDSYEIAEHAVSAVAFEIQTEGTTPEARQFMSQAVAKAPRLQSLHVFDANGNLALTTSPDLAPSGNQRGQGYFERHRQNAGAPIVGAPMPAGSGEKVITVSQRFDQPDGSFGGVVLAALDPAYFTKVYEGLDVGHLGAMGLYDSGGTLLSDAPPRPEAPEPSATPPLPFFTPTPGTLSGSFESDASPARGPDLNAFDRSARYPVVAEVAMSRDEALGGWGREAIMRALFTGALVLALVLGGMHLVEQIRRRRSTESVLREKEGEFRLLAESASDLVERFDAEGTRIYISPALERLTGYRPEELIGKNAFEVINDEDRPAVEAAASRLRSGTTEQETVTFRRLHKDGHEIWLETSLRVAAEQIERRGVVGVTRDITDRKRLEMKLEGMAMLDGLTGIANRRAFDAALVREVARSRRTGSPLSLLMIDADRFKRFNDDHGHLAGDTCLKAIAAVVAIGARRATDVAARYGGEELALLLPDTKPDRARVIAVELCRQVQALAIPHERNLPWRVATISIGVATIDPTDEDAVHDGAWLISTADLALYDAKSQGRNQSVAAPTRLRPRMVG